MPAWDHERRLKHLAATSAVLLNADIRLRCNICRNGPEGDMATTREERPELRSSGLECFAKLCDHRQRYCGAVVPVTRLALVAFGVFSGTGHAPR
jgi:hypothetical protein